MKIAFLVGLEFLKMKLNFIIFFLSISIISLLYSCFIGKNGYNQLNTLKKEKEELEIAMLSLQTANRRIQDNVTSLIEDLEAVEHEARQKLGLIQENEVFFKEEVLETSKSKISH